MLKKIFFVTAISLFLTAVLSVGPVSAADRLAVSAQKAKILFLSGDVKMRAAGLSKWVDAQLGMVLSVGDNVATGQNSWVEIGFGDNYVNVVRVKENTTLELINLGPVKVGLLKGELRSLIENLSKDSTFEIKTPTAVCGARGTGWDTQTDGQKVIVDAYEREVYFYALDKDGNIAGEDPIIKAGKRGIMEGPLKPISIRNIPKDRMSDWGKWKQGYKERIGAGNADIKQKSQKIQSAQKAINTVMKGKASVLQKKDQEGIDKRLKETKSSCPESP